MSNPIGPAAVDMLREFVAILVHTLAYSCGLSYVRKKFSMIGPLIIALTVTAVGFTATYFRFPAPIPVGILILFYLTRFRWRDTLLAYLITWLVYASCHVLFSLFFRYNLLIPAFPLRS
ncbi:MAG: hypothetical protein HYR55_19810 [Acidobacteria bacterium]|nr:hypothetical protein [Acidobacteriota bacterium]MBI3658431.1 hypothetical protein [Acidobacteriota bacterium]